MMASAQEKRHGGASGVIGLQAIAKADKK